MGNHLPHIQAWESRPFAQRNLLVCRNSERFCHPSFCMKSYSPRQFHCLLAILKLSSNRSAEKGRKGDLVKLSSMSLALIKDIVRAREVSKLSVWLQQTNWQQWRKTAIQQGENPPLLQWKSGRGSGETDSSLPSSQLRQQTIEQKVWLCAKKEAPRLTLVKLLSRVVEVNSIEHQLRRWDLKSSRREAHPSRFVPYRYR